MLYVYKNAIKPLEADTLLGLNLYIQLFHL